VKQLCFNNFKTIILTISLVCGLDANRRNFLGIYFLRKETIK